LSSQPARPALHPDLIAGPWESVGASGIDGIFFHIETGSSGPAERQQAARQTVDIRVYHRQGGKETAGWFATSDEATSKSNNIQDLNPFTRVDADRLQIHFADASDLKPFDLDISFSPADHVWTGSWTRADQALKVTLERPRPNAGVTSNAFVGDWEREPDPISNFPSAPGSLHIRESSDGFLSAWLNRTISGTDPRTRAVQSDQRSGEPLKVVSAIGDEIILETSFAMGHSHRYRGNLSEDNRVLAGTCEDGGERHTECARPISQSALGVRLFVHKTLGCNLRLS